MSQKRQAPTTPDFFNSGETIAFLHANGKWPVRKDALVMLVTHDNKTETQSFMNHVVVGKVSTVLLAMSLIRT